MSKGWLCHKHAQHIQKGDSIYSCGCVKRNDTMVLIVADVDYPEAPCRYHAPAIFNHITKKEKMK